MADSTDNFLPVDQLAVEDLATEAAKAWKNIRELTLAYRTANDKLYPAKFEYNQALRDSSAGGAARRFSAKNTLRDVINNENSAYSALLAGKKRFNDIQQRRLEVAKSMAASGFHQQNIGGGDSGGGDGGGSVTVGAANAGRLIYSWLRRTTTGFFTSGKYVMTRLRGGAMKIDPRSLRSGMNDVMSAAFGSRNAIWDSKILGRMNGLLSGSKAGVIGAIVGLAADVFNNQADKARKSAEIGLDTHQQSLETGLTMDQIKQYKDIGAKYGVTSERGQQEFFQFLANLQKKLNYAELHGGDISEFQEAAYVTRGRFNYGKLIGTDASKNLDAVVAAFMDSLKGASPAERASALASIGARGAAAEIITRGRTNYKTDVVDVTANPDHAVDQKLRYEQALRLRADTARTLRAEEADLGRHLVGRTEAAITQEKAKQLYYDTDAIGAFSNAIRKATETVDNLNKQFEQQRSIGIGIGGPGMMILPPPVIPSTIAPQADGGAAASGSRAPQYTVNGDVHVHTAATSLSGATKDGLNAGLANAFPNAKK